MLRHPFRDCSDAVRLALALAMVLLAGSACDSDDPTATDTRLASGAPTSSGEELTPIDDRPAADSGVSTDPAGQPPDRGTVSGSADELPSTAAVKTTIVLDQPRTTATASQDDPVPVNEIVEIHGAWDIAVTEVDTDAAQQLLAYANVNPRPAPDERFVLVTFHGQYLGDGIAQPVFVWSITDGENEKFGQEVPGCGLIPDSIYDVDEVRAGETIVASVCASVPESIVANGLFLTLQPLDDVEYVFSLTS